MILTGISGRKNSLSSQLKKHKRSAPKWCLETVSSICDPLGFVLPFVVSPVVFLQELWRLKVAWDEVVSEWHQEYSKDFFFEWTKSLLKFTILEISRFYHVLGFETSNIQLHIFSYVSEVVYGAVDYLILIFKKEKPHCFFAMAKTRLASFNTIS